jgi:predicted PurR-regulated permease PerM
VAVGAVVLGLTAALWGLGAFLVTSVTELAKALPVYEGAFERTLAEALATARGWGLDVPDRAGLVDAAPAAAFRVLASLLGEVGELLTAGLLALLGVVFLLLEASGFRDKLARAFGAESAAAVAPAFAAFSAGVKQYLYIKTLVSLMTGTLVAVLLAVLGVDFPLLWGVVAFLLNYIPNVGSIVAAVPGTLLAMLEHGLGVGLVAALGYFAINFSIGNVLEPRWMGRGVGLSPFVVLLALVAWTFVLGPVGLLLAVPLTVTLKIALEARADTRWLAVLLGPDAPPGTTSPVPELSLAMGAIPDADAALREEAAPKSELGV